MDAVEKAKSGHPGMPMGMADVATVLFQRFMKFDASRPDWPDRDRFVLSAGHGSMLLYALLYLLGYPGMGREELENFRQLGSPTAGHPEYGHAAGVETTTGPLGQGLATAVGMAIAERLSAARFGDDLVDHFTYVLAGDGCLMEGVSHEAIDLAGHLKLSKLIVLWDDNSISIDGPTSLATSTDQIARFAAAGWHVAQSTAMIPRRSRRRSPPRRPTRGLRSSPAARHRLWRARPSRARNAATARRSARRRSTRRARRSAGRMRLSNFQTTFCDAWRAAGRRGATAREAWEARRAASPKGADFEAFLKGDVAAEVAAPLADFRATLAAEKPKVATRKSSEMALGVINAATQATIGGSADLTHSNFTITKGMGEVTPDDFSGRYIHYGVREFGMAAAMNGIALHGGFVPYGGTFLVFSDYARGAIRLSALMGLRVIYVLTHDFDRTWRRRADASAGRASRRAARHAESQRLPPRRRDRDRRMLGARARQPQDASVLSLSRQNLPTLERPVARKSFRERRLCAARGGRQARRHAARHRLRGRNRARGGRMLAAQGMQAAVVSMPCWELFEAQPQAYRAEVLGAAPRVAVEAAVRLGWDRWLGERGAFIGMSGFGASGPAAELYKHFGITAEAVAEAAGALVKA